MQHAAGIHFVAKDGTCLLLKRTDGAGWAFPGGGIEDGETPEACARRELKEETGVEYTGALETWTRSEKDGCHFTTFIARLDRDEDKFQPTLNAEHDAFSWENIETALQREDLHPGAARALKRHTQTELDIAEALVSGELTGAHRFANLLLVPMRITGTGAAYRTKFKEFVWRDPKFYLNDRFLKRCQGLAVVLDHPEAEKLTTEDYRQRNVGSIMLPYIKGDEVWGIAKIYDGIAAAILETEQLSTSPGVLYMNKEPGVELENDDGSTLLVEDEPSLLDHLAIVRLGVWDKAGPPTGIESSTSEPTQEVLSMGDKTKVEAEPRKDSATDASKLDQLLQLVTGLKEGQDKLTARVDAMEAAKEDADEDEESEQDADEDEESEEKQDADTDEQGQEKQDADGEEGEEKKDADESEEKKDADAEDKKDVDGYMEGGQFHPIRGSKGYSRGKGGDKSKGKKKGKSRRDADSPSEMAALRAQIAEMNKRIPAEISETDRAQFVAAQARADKHYQAFGDSAPRWLNGESLLAYRCRLAQGLKKHSKSWSGVELSALPDSALAVAEQTIYADAWDVATRGAGEAVAGVLREVVSTDRTGRRISHFYGDPEACWAPFKGPKRVVSRINTKFDH